MDKTTLKWIAELKAEQPFAGLHERAGQQGEYKLKILARGEQAFYQQGDRATIFELIAGQGLIFRDSIKRWDDGKKISDAERDLIVERVAAYLKAKGAATIKVV